MARKRKRPSGQRFGIGEWFGEVFAELSLEDRERYVAAARVRKQSERPPCPFKPLQDGLQLPCTKQSGVCSLRLFEIGDDQAVRPVSDSTDALRCTCPYRFREGNIIDSWIGEELLGIETPLSVAEVPFLKGDTKDAPSPEAIVSDDDDDFSASVGRIDNVLIHPELSYLRWCAVELQAVYFSGPAMGDDFAAFTDSLSHGIPFPTKTRRPDYRSSGPKRLMPQLQIKVPTLRRWGKKMAVVVDEAFFASLGAMDEVKDVSNCDIAWFVVGFELNGRSAKMVKRRRFLTTLEDAVEGLTAGRPVTLPQFEEEIRQKLDRPLRRQRPASNQTSD